MKVEGQSKTMRLCTKCTRIIRKMYPRVTEEVKKDLSAARQESSKVKTETPKEEVSVA